MEQLPKYLEICRKYAINHPYDDKITFRHASIIVSGGRIIGVGHNRLYSPVRFNAALARRANRHQNENHAELSAIVNFLSYTSSENNAKLYVCRVLRNGQLANSKPCDMCERVIRNCGFIKRVFYSIAEDEYGVIRL